MASWHFDRLHVGDMPSDRAVRSVNRMMGIVEEVFDKLQNPGDPICCNDWHMWIDGRLDDFIGQGDSIPIGNPAWSAPWTINFQGGSGPSGPGTIIFGPRTTLSGPSSASGPFFYWGGPAYFDGPVTFNGPVIGVGGLCFCWVKYTLTYADFADPSTSKTVNLVAVATGGNVTGAKIKPRVAFSGGGIASYTTSIGGFIPPATNLPNLIMAPYNVFAAPSDANFLLETYATPNLPFAVQVAGSYITVTATSTGANLDQASQGIVDIWLRYEVPT